MRLLFLISVIIVFSFSGCQSNYFQDDEILAAVNGVILTKDAARNQIPNHIFDADSVKAFTQFRDDWVQRQVILQEAERLNFTRQAHIQERLKRVQEEFILQAVQDFIIAETETDITISESEVNNYYQQNLDKFRLNERYVKYRHLVASNRADAEQARVELLRGVSWPDVAQSYSKDPELRIRESQEFWPISMSGNSHPMTRRYLDVIGINEISVIYSGDDGFHFVQLIDEKAEGEHPELNWLLDQIREWLILEKRKRAFNTYVKNLYLQAQANNEITLYSVSAETETSNSNSTITND